MAVQDEYILVTGGAGYIGSHTVIELINHGYKVIIVDNLCNSCYDAVARVEFIVRKSIKFFKLDLRDKEGLAQIFDTFKIKGVIHFAALKAVGESMKLPLEYYDNNICGTITLLNVMREHRVKTIVFSSSATVYGDATRFDNMIPIPESCPNDPTNPYGKTKYAIENIIKDLHTSDNTWRGAILRYFNPIGAHPSGLLGEDPLGIPNNLLPFLAQVAIGRREKLLIFGDDYDSHDGTPIRDYIHVVDLAKGHIAALNYLNKINSSEGMYREWNLGTGKGSSVFDIYHAFCKEVGKDLPYEVVGRRTGDVLNLTASPTRANSELKWKAELSITDACRDLWKWTIENPFGFQIDNYKWKLFNPLGIMDYKNRLHTICFQDLEVSIANYGALVQAVRYKGRNLVNGFNDFSRYKLKENPFFGATIGRFANRIANGQFEVNGHLYTLCKNENNKTTLHGGNNGFDKQFFLGPIARQYEDYNTLEFILVDKDGNNGFPSDLETLVKYTIKNNSLEIEYKAVIPEYSKLNVTAVNLTNHSYWNLASPNKTIDGTIIKSTTNFYLKVNSETSLPTGDIVEWQNDITKPTKLDPNISFDNCFIVDREASKFCLDTRKYSLKYIVEAIHPSVPVKLVVSTTEPAFQLYTGDGNDICEFQSRSGFCVETGRFINALNNEKWSKQVILRKGEVYGARSKFSLYAQDLEESKHFLDSASYNSGEYY